MPEAVVGRWGSEVGWQRFWAQSERSGGGCRGSMAGFAGDAGQPAALGGSVGGGSEGEREVSKS